MEKKTTAERKSGKHRMRNLKEKPYSEIVTSNLTVLTENAIELEPPNYQLTQKQD